MLLLLPLFRLTLWTNFILCGKSAVCSLRYRVSIVLFQLFLICKALDEDLNIEGSLNTERFDSSLPKK